MIERSASTVDCCAAAGQVAGGGDLRSHLPGRGGALLAGGNVHQAGRQVRHTQPRGQRRGEAPLPPTSIQSRNRLRSPHCSMVAGFPRDPSCPSW
eukprot:1730271-Pyramimonas_sp.AAC.1